MPGLIATASRAHASRGAPWIALVLAVLVFGAFARLAMPRHGAGMRPVWEIAGADARRGRALIAQVGCSGCHTIPGVHGARGNVGPPLDRFGERAMIAGMLPNEPRGLVRWLSHPQSVVPGNAMPDMGLDERNARDIAAYLYTLR